MGELINLNRTRKQRERAKQSAEAAENRVRFGRTKAEKQREQQADKAERRDLDGKKLDD